MAEPLTESSTPGGEDAQRRAPDPAGTRPKVDLNPTSSPGLLGIPPGDRPAGPAGGPGLLVGGATAGVAGGAAGALGGGEVGGATGGAGVAAGAGLPGPRARERSDVLPAEGRRSGSDRVDSPHGSRFQFVTGALLALGLSAIAITVLTLRSDRSDSPAKAAAWSSWHPTGTGYVGAAEIGNHVAVEYRLPNKAQMVAIQAGPPQVGNVPVLLALQSDPTDTGNVAVLAGSPVQYKMCGLGASCSIAGTPSPERLTLVRREALELALDTFEYVTGANQVIILLPPTLIAPPAGSAKTVKPTYATSGAMFFESTQLRDQLDRPLNTTLTATPPTVAAIDKAPDTATVTRLTTPSLFTYTLEPQTDAGTIDSIYMVMSPAK